MNTHSRITNVLKLQTFQKEMTVMDGDLKIFVLAKGNSGSIQILTNTLGHQLELSNNFSCYFVEVDKLPEVVELMGVGKFPSIFFVRNGEILYYHIGFISGGQIANKVHDFEVAGSRY